MAKRFIAPSRPLVQSSPQCGCDGPIDAPRRVTKWTAVAGVLGALGVCTACCLLPFVLISIGVAGAWVGGLEALARYKWIFVLVTFGSLALGFHSAYRKRNGNPSEAVSGNVSRSERAVRLWLWIATALAISGIVFEQVEPMLRR